MLMGALFWADLVARAKKAPNVPREAKEGR